MELKAIAHKGNMIQIKFSDDKTSFNFFWLQLIKAAEMDKKVKKKDRRSKLAGAYNLAWPRSGLVTNHQGHPSRNFDEISVRESVRVLRL